MGFPKLTLFFNFYFLHLNPLQPSSSSSSPKPTTIEVERKFSVPPDYQAVLSEHGFELVKEFKETLSDDYFDSSDYDLMQADHWLRRRNGDWELKYPVSIRLLCLH